MGISIRKSAIRDGTLGESRTRLYRIWKGIKQRVLNPQSISYKNYGGRGITVCQEWTENFQPFKEWALSHGYKNNLTIDRINNDGNYEPENCRWVTYKEQAGNKRNSTSTAKYYVIEFNGTAKTIGEWSKQTGVSVNTIRNRLYWQNWSVKRALTEPVGERSNLYAHNPNEFRKIIQSKHNTVHGFSRTVGIAYETMSRIINGKRGVKSATAQKICRLLGIEDANTVFKEARNSA